MDSVLNDIRVLDLSSFMAGPVCGMFLGCMGAEVIRIEPPGGGVDRVWGMLVPDGENLGFKIFSRNKKSITLALNSKKGKDILGKLVRQSDVVLHNYVPGSHLAKEVAYETLEETNPGIIVAALSGYGQSGPYAERVALDFAIQGHSGEMVMNGFAGDPPTKANVPYLDYASGLSAALAILLALNYRQKTGIGQAIDISLFDTALFLTQSMGALAFYEMYGKVRKQLGNSGFAAYQTCVETKDGMVMITPSTPSIWNRFIKVVDRRELTEKSEFETDMDRMQNSSFIDPIIQDWARPKTVDEVVTALQKARVPAAPVLGVDQLLNDPQVTNRGMITNSELAGYGKVSLPGIPIKLSKTPMRVTHQAPELGSHNGEIYNGLLGLTQNQLANLQQEGVI